MKKNVLFLLVVLLATTFSVEAQRGMRIGYIDMEYILQNVKEYQSANAQLGAKAQKWKSEIEQRKGVIEQMKKDLSVEKVLLTKELIAEREEEIGILEKELLEYQQDRFGPQGDLIIQRNLLAKPVQDQVFTAVQEIAKNRRYDMIFDRSDAVMLFALEKHDISDLVLRSINREEKRAERLEKGKQAKQRFSEDDAAVTPEIDPEVEARKQEAEQRKLERQQELEDLKQKKADEREAKKKAYEERRKKLLEERAARKKAKEDARKKAKEEDQEEDNSDDENN